MVVIHYIYMRDSLQMLFGRWSRSASYPLFAWLCILVLPIALNLIAGLNDEFRSSLGEYYGSISLFLMFQFSLGFSTLFLTTMHVTSVGRSELVEQLRLTTTGPADLIRATVRHLSWLLWPPAAAFLILVFGWMMFQAEQQFVFRMVNLDRALVFLALLAMAQLGSMLIICLGMGRNVFWFVLLALPVQFLLTGGAIFLMVARILPWWVLPFVSLAAVWLLFWLATASLRRLWPPQKLILSGNG